jgi:hypothetical protein
LIVRARGVAFFKQERKKNTILAEQFPNLILKSQKGAKIVIPNT